MSLDVNDQKAVCEFVSFQFAHPSTDATRFAGMIRKEIETHYRTNILDKLFKEFRRRIAQMNFVKNRFVEYVQVACAETAPKYPDMLVQKSMGLTMGLRFHINAYNELADRVVENLEVKRIEE